MLNYIPDHTKALIFDLGGVIVDLAPEKTVAEFAKLSTKPAAQILDLYATHSCFLAFEKGLTGAEDFRNSIRQIFNVRASDAEIDHCWNAMLVGIPPEKLFMLIRLKKHFTTLILSNTNSIHLAYINDVILREQHQDLDPFVHHAYYSHKLGMRKPDRDIFEYVLQAHSLVPGQTLFLDDNGDNIASAKSLGMETMLIEHPSRVAELFKNYA